MCPIKKFEVETYNVIMDVTLNELSDRFETTNIDPLKDIALLSIRRIREVQKNPTVLPKDAFTKLCKIYSKINRDHLIIEYMQFCRNFDEFENSSNLPVFLHSENNSELSDEEDEDISTIELNTLDYLNINQAEQKSLHNVCSTKKIFEIFCLANLSSIFPNLYIALKISVTLPISSCSVERSFSKLKIIKNKLRTSMLQERLENLMQISCEKDINPNIENVILLLASKSSRLCKSLIY